MENKPNLKLIHVGMIQPHKKPIQHLLLRKKDASLYAWYELADDNSETETGITDSTAEGAIQLARRQWKNERFQTLNCGFRYTLPERDEHGLNALFYQMVASYSTMTGVYFDEDLGNNCIVNFASQEARDYWQKLKQSNKL